MADLELSRRPAKAMASRSRLGAADKSGVAQGYTHGCYVRLTDLDSLTDSYWNHSAHQELLAEIDSACAERFAIDFIRKT